MFLRSPTLVKLCIGAGFGTAGLSLFMMYHQHNLYKNCQFVKDAMNTLENHEGATMLLGPPLAVATVRPLPPAKESEPSPLAQFCARVVGNKEKGLMYFWAERIPDGEKIKIVVKRIELQVDNDKSKRLVVKAS